MTVYKAVKLYAGFTKRAIARRMAFVVGDVILAVDTADRKTLALIHALVQ